MVVSLAHAKRDLLDDLGRVGLLARIGEDHIFPTNPTTVTAFRLAKARSEPLTVPCLPLGATVAPKRRAKGGTP
jgi:hypothetical protein